MDSIVDVDDEFEEHTDSNPGGKLFHPTPLLVKYGWVILLLLGIVFVVVKKLFGELDRNRTFTNNQCDPEVDIRRREAMELARIKMQQRMDADVARHKVEQAEREKRRAADKLRQWELRQSGQSTKEQNTDMDEPKAHSCARRPKPKAYLRPDNYNPLMGDSSGSRYRQAPRFGSRGGG